MGRFTSPETSLVVNAANHEEAAEEFAEHFHNDDASWAGGEISIQEIDESDSPLDEPQTFSIVIDWSPTFSAFKV